MKSTIGLAILVAAVPLLGFPARADVAPPETEPCLSKQAGDACTYNNASGTCLDQTCSKIDYANWDRDASWPPPSMTYACVECIVGTTATTTTTATATATTTTTATTTANTNTNTTTKTNADGGAPPANDDSACSIGKQITAKRVASWLLAGAFSLLFLFGRRRRR
jgi:hypothetical protein